MSGDLYVSDQRRVGIYGVVSAIHSLSFSCSLVIASSVVNHIKRHGKEFTHPVLVASKANPMEMRRLVAGRELYGAAKSQPQT
jgi:hypothetical protein